MQKKKSKRLVIDASIARAAGTTDHPVSNACRDFLQSVITYCHKVVWSKEIEEEWTKERAHKFTRKWQVSFFQKKKIARISVAENKELRSKIDDLRLPKNKKQEIIKDIHLIEAALAADKVIISRDDAALGNFKTTAAIVKELKNIAWVNPTVETEKAIDWLKKGAELEKERLLGS